MGTYYAVKLTSGEYFGRMSMRSNFGPVASPFRHETPSLVEAEALARMRPDATVVDSATGRPVHLVTWHDYKTGCTHQAGSVIGA
jgi:hypothetical protein